MGRYRCCWGERDVYLVVGNTGAHEPGAVFSVWDSEERAAAECFRLAKLPDGLSMSVVHVELNTPSELDEWGYATPKN